MKEVSQKLDELIAQGWNWISKCKEEEFALKRSPDRWSKKEILGHLIDSAINNLKRFTEVQFEVKPYAYVSYNQNELVKVNDYQNADTQEILELWKALNIRIKIIMDNQTEESLAYKVLLSDGSVSDLRYLMTDYVDHLSHHMIQIMVKVE